MVGAEGSHPDLRKAICDAVNQVMTADDFPDEHRMKTPASPERVSIRCQRTWHDISTINQHLNGGSLSACVAQFEDGDDLFSFFIEGVLLPDKAAWGVASSSGGKQPPERRKQAGGFRLSGGSHVCVGGVGQIPDGGTLRVEMADGTSHESTAVDDCAIVFAPVTSPPSPDDHVTVRWFNPDGTELGADRVRIGDGKSPPGRQ